MTSINMPAMIAAGAKEKASPAEKRLPGNNSSGSFYKQLKQMSQRPKCQPGKDIIADNPGNNSWKPGSNEVKTDDGTETIAAGGSKKYEPDSRGLAGTNPQESGASTECNSAARGDDRGTGEAEALPVAELFVQLFPTARQAALPEQEGGQSALNPEAVSTDDAHAENPVKSVMFVSEAPVAEEGDMVLPAASGTAPAGDWDASLATIDGKPVLEDQVRPPNSDSDISPAAAREPQIGTAPTPAGAGQEITVVDGKSGLVFSEDNTPATPAISSSGKEAEPALKDELAKDHSRSEGEAKQEVRLGQTVSAGDKAAKEAPEIKQWVKELWSDQRIKSKAAPDSGSEEKTHADRGAAASSRTVPATDVKKLIDFESHRLNGRRLSSEPQTAAEGKAQAAGDEGKGFISELARNSADGLKTAAPGGESSRNLPSAREIMAQVVQKAELLFSHKLSELKIDLKPEFLGRLTIKVMVEEGVVTARFIAENQQVRHLLENNMPTLRQNLEAQGLRVDRAEVNVALNNGGMFDGSEGSRQYLWQEGQSPGRHQGEAYPGDNYDEAIYPEEMISAVMAENETGFNENGKLSFLV
ncbi:flagellar hook-length control protein FliK [Syntrophomonas curvata]